VSTDQSLVKLTNEAIEKLDLAMSELFKISQSDRYEKYHIGTLRRSIGLIREFQKPIFERYPELRPPLPGDDAPDPPLTKEQVALVKKLNETDIKRIDKALLSNACEFWRKVAHVVGTTMMELPERVKGIPDIYYAQRIRHLVEEGKLESQGNLAYMRYSEVRLPSKELDNKT
jgi:hypothetical protein